MVIILLVLSSVFGCFGTNIKSHLTDGVEVRNSVSTRKWNESFINHYESNINGKFTHEYHPYLLSYTSSSLDQLEKALHDAAISVASRIMLMGYEEQGIPHYTTDFAQAFFTDEMSRKTNAGWSAQMYNRFGLLTGFLFKDCVDTLLPIEQIDIDQIEIFDGTGTLFQQHAFGQVYDPLMMYKDIVQLAVSRGDLALLGRVLQNFWKTLYEGSFRISGDQHVAGTQDILFSIAYIDHIKKSSAAVKKFFLGPDFTYPIETSIEHPLAVTRHAQAFVGRMAEQLAPINGEETAYIFCSFVDGVGKSTLLGNLENWKKYRNRFDQYEHVDNSSSQHATVWEFTDKVWIADLPAQVSHFTYKPDGYVYVPVGATPHDSAAPLKYVQENRQELQKNFFELCQKISGARSSAPYEKNAGPHMQNRSKSSATHREDCANKASVVPNEGPAISEKVTVIPDTDPGPDSSAQSHPPRSEGNTFQYEFAYNTVLLNTPMSHWIPFSYGGHEYIYNEKHTELRVLYPLSDAPSHGLKNSNPEQMLFTKGVLFPARYDHFVDDLITQLKTRGVKRVVMVDFMSMYSRSSRENIRVNYVVQQLARLQPSFALANTLYQPFAGNEYVLSALVKPECRQHFARSLAYEAQMRSELFGMLLEHDDTELVNYQLLEVTDILRKRISCAGESVFAQTVQHAQKKMQEESERLYDVYATSKEFIIGCAFQAHDLVRFSCEFLLPTFTRQIVHPRINALWDRFLGATQVTRNTTDRLLESCLCTESGVLDNGTHVDIVGVIHPQATDRRELAPLWRRIRAQWYAAIANIAMTNHYDGNQYTVKELFPTLPLIVVPDQHGLYCLCQLPMELLVEDGLQASTYLVFNQPFKSEGEHWGAYEKTLYWKHWDQTNTTADGVFAFGLELPEQQKENNSLYDDFLGNSVTNWYQMLKNQSNIEHIVPPHTFLTSADACASLEREYRSIQKSAQKKEVLGRDIFEYIGVLHSQHDSNERLYGKQRFVAQKDQYDGIRLWARAIATLELICRDADAYVAVRPHNRSDFIAALDLLEHSTLLHSFFLVCGEPLFEKTDLVQPVLSGLLEE